MNALLRLARSCQSLRWSPRLLRLILEELGVDRELTAVLGQPERIPAKRIPQTVAIAIALRHSWRPDGLARIARRLRQLHR